MSDHTDIGTGTTVKVERPPKLPSVGRIVMYQTHGSADGGYPCVQRAALVTAIAGTPEGEPGSRLFLAIFNPTGIFFQPNVPYSDKPHPGCWNWPDIV